MRMCLLMAVTGLLLGALGLAQAPEPAANKSPCAPGCGGCGAAEKPVAATNPFFAPYGTPYNVPPFEKIKLEHFRPAFEEGMKRNLAEIAAIVNNPQPPTFANTIEALDRSGELLGEVGSVFFGRVSVDTNDEIQQLNQEIAPRLAAHRDAIAMNPKLFLRVRMLYNQREQLGLTGEQLYLLENLYRGYIRSGVSLPEVEQEKLRGINRQLSVLGVKYSQNVLVETNAFRLVIEKAEELAGLPEASVAAAAEEARRVGLDGKWVFTTQKPSMLPFLQYAKNRELRRQLYTAYIQRGDKDNANDNKAIFNDIMKLRVERAKLLGYPTYAHYVLENRMARTPDRVYDLLNRLWAAALPVARKEAQQLQAIIDQEGGGFKLASWDWWYYAEKLRKAQYDLDDAELRPYFKLDNVRDGVFYVANRLYGLSFEPLADMPKPHPEAQVFRVKDKDGSHLGVLYMDFHPRASKRAGAWCGAYRSEYKRDGRKVPPVVTLVTNCTRPSGDGPALLSLEEVSTLFHEFGHALDNLLSNVTYDTTFRATDFVELPSQIMEHWAVEPEVLRQYARHYGTGAVIPDALVTKINKSRLFNQGFETVEYLAASLLDMKYHTLVEPQNLDIDKFEADYLNAIGLIPEIVSRYRSTYFTHIIGGYAAGYYSYIWSGVLDCDAFEAFVETSLFDAKTADAFRKHVLEVNGTMDSAVMYRNFRGRDPKIEPLLKNRGLN